MTAQALAEKLYDDVVRSGRVHYAGLLESATVADVRDSFWGRFLPFFDRLAADDRQLMLDLTTQVAVDTIAATSVLADDGEIVIEIDGASSAGELWATFADHDEAQRAR